MRDTYKIVRHYFHAVNGSHRRVIARGLSLEQAQAHCHDPNTSSRTAYSAEARRRTKSRGPWFDGYDKE